MDPFPEEWELIGVFEAEPELADPGVPWAYNRLCFDTVRGDDHIHCVIEPGYETVEFTWSQGDVPRLSLDLHWVRGLTARTGSGREILTLELRDASLLPLEIQLKPTIQVKWGTRLA
jgi:hypothetical protein